MNGMLLAEGAILVQLQSLRIVLFVLHRVVVPVLAFGAFKGNFRSVYGSHRFNSMQKNHTSRGVFLKSIIFSPRCQPFLRVRAKFFAPVLPPPQIAAEIRAERPFFRKSEGFFLRGGGVSLYNTAEPSGAADRRAILQTGGST